MAKQLNIRSDEAYERATRLARRWGTTTADAVVRALRKADETPRHWPRHDELTEAQKRDHAHFMALASRAKAEMINPDFSEQDLYGEDGLPK